MRASSLQRRSNLSDSPLHIATPPAYRATSLFDVEWNSSPPASREHNVFETEWNAEQADSVIKCVPLRQHGQLNTRVVKPRDSWSISIFQEGVGNRKNVHGSYHHLRKHGGHIPSCLDTSNKLPQLGAQARAHINKTVKQPTRIFDLSNLSRSEIKSMRTPFTKKKLSNSKTLPRRYQGFSEKTVLLLTSKSRWTFATNFRK